jgi:uncharacterized membrane protein
MPEKSRPSQAEAPDGLEERMQKVSLGVSLAGVGLMVAGFVDMLINKASSSIPGGSVLPLPMFIHLSQVPVSLVAMSAGIALLALLPALRVLLALWLYLRHRDVLNALAALIVFLELLLSIRVGG